MLDYLFICKAKCATNLFLHSLRMKDGKFCILDKLSWSNTAIGWAPTFPFDKTWRIKKCSAC